MNSKATRNALFLSIVSLLLCFVMLMGTTFAWFVDRVQSTGNRIEAGDLEVDLVMYNENTGNYVSITNVDGDLFSLSDTTGSLWSPGVTRTIYFGVRNTGSLAVKYDAYIEVDNQGLAEVLQYAVAENYGQGTVRSFVDAAEADGPSGPLDVKRITVAEDKVLEPVVEGPEAPEKEGETDYYALTVKMVDNAPEEYQNTSVKINIIVNATQASIDEGDADDDSGEDSSVVSEIPEEEKNTTLSGTSWKLKEEVDDYEFLEETEEENETADRIFPEDCIISDGENEYEISALCVKELDGVKLLTTAQTENSEEAEMVEKVFVYYPKTDAVSEEAEADENSVYGWYLVDYLKLQTLLEREDADLAGFTEIGERIEDDEKLPVITFAEGDSSILENKDLIDWLYSNAEIQISEDEARA